MSIDTSVITESVSTVVQQGIDFLPVGIAIVGIPSAIGIGLAFGGRIVGMIKTAFGGSR